MVPQKMVHQDLHLVNIEVLFCKEFNNGNEIQINEEKAVMVSIWKIDRVRATLYILNILVSLNKYLRQEKLFFSFRIKHTIRLLIAMPTYGDGSCTFFVEKSVVMVNSSQLVYNDLIMLSISFIVLLKPW